MSSNHCTRMLAERIRWIAKQREMWAEEHDDQRNARSAEALDQLADHIELCYDDDEPLMARLIPVLFGDLDEPVFFDRTYETVSLYGFHSGKSVGGLFSQMNEFLEHVADIAEEEHREWEREMADQAR